MSPPGRPKGEYRRAKHGGCLMSTTPGRPKAGENPTEGRARYAVAGGLS